MRDEDGARDACQSPMAASKLLSGGSLPPRKRLLVELKQNGWSISCSPSPCASHLCTGNLDAAVGAGVAATAANGDANGSAAATGGMEVQKQVEEGCPRCGGCEDSAWRQLWKHGVHERFCNSCVMLYSTNLYCPHCLGLYEGVSNLGDASVWIVCCKCQRSVHVACESENHNKKPPDPLSYLCPNCSMPKSPSNGFFGSREKLCTENKGSPVNCLELKEEGFAETPSGNPYLRYHVSKKLHHETGLGLGHRPSVPASSAASLGCDSSLATTPVSPREYVVTAKAAAYVSAKAAVAARARATAKASVAAKAAAVARAALEAAALAARAEERAREELSHRSGLIESEGQDSARIHAMIATEWEVGENIDKADTSVDDEELARQLHRAMNSSSRITRSATPSRKKIEIKNEVDAEGKSFTHGVSCSYDEPPPFPKPQSTRPRSSIHKENKRWEPRFSNFDSAKLERKRIENDLQLSTSETALIKDEITNDHECRSPPSQWIEHLDSSLIVAHKLDAVISPNTSTNDRNGHNVKLHSLGRTSSSAVSEDRTKVGYKIKKIADVTACEAANLSAEEPKAKQTGVLETRIDACMRIEDGFGAFRVVEGAEINAESHAGNKLRVCSQVLDDQACLRDDRTEDHRALEKKVGKAIDKQKVHNWKSVSKLLSSADNRRVLSDEGTLSLMQRSDDKGGNTCIGRRNGVKNGQCFNLKHNFNDHQHAQIKGTVHRHEVKHSPPKRKASDADEAVSTLGSSCKVTNLKDDLTSRHVDPSKTKKLATVANAIPLRTASSSVSAKYISLSNQP